MSKLKDLTGLTFGRLTVIGRAPSVVRNNGSPRTMWYCQCSCGKTVTVTGDNLTRGNSLSCGCYHYESASKDMTTHGKSNSRIYNVWCAMKNRCYNPNVPSYRLYGARGIVMCDEWKTNFVSFYGWALQNGYDENAPRGVCTIDRIDNDKGYNPENCRIATQQEQMNNVSTNHRITYNGESHTLAEWSRITGISAFTIRNRIAKLGWSPERALQTT